MAPFNQVEQANEQRSNAAAQRQSDQVGSSIAPRPSGRMGPPIQRRGGQNGPSGMLTSAPHLTGRATAPSGPPVNRWAGPPGQHAPSIRGRSSLGSSHGLPRSLAPPRFSRTGLHQTTRGARLPPVRGDGGHRQSRPNRDNRQHDPEHGQKHAPDALLESAKRPASPQQGDENKRPRLDVDPSDQSISGAASEEEPKSLTTGTKDDAPPVDSVGDDDGWTAPADDDLEMRDYDEPSTNQSVDPGVPSNDMSTGKDDEKQPCKDVDLDSDSNDDEDDDDKDDGGGDDDDDDDANWEVATDSHSRKKELSLQKKRSEAMQAKVDLSRKVVRLEDRAKANDRFAPPLLKIVNHFIDADALRAEVVADNHLSNPSSFGIPLPSSNGLHSLNLKNWLSIEPRADNEPDFDVSWFDENTLANMVMLETGNRPSRAFFCDPGSLYVWLSSQLSIQTRVNRIQTAIRGMETDGRVPRIDGSNYKIPGFEMPADATSMVFPFNSGFHWVALKLEPDFETKKGKILLFDSLDANSVLKKVQQIMPSFAQLVGLRPDLNWKQESWEVVKGRSTRQKNSTDCGPITAKNCADLVNGQEISVFTEPAMITSFGEQLRYEFLGRMFLLLTSKPMSSAFNQGNNGASSGTNGASSGSNDPPPGGKSDQTSGSGSKTNKAGEGKGKATKTDKLNSQKSTTGPTTRSKVGKQKLDRESGAHSGDELFPEDELGIEPDIDTDDQSDCGEVDSDSDLFCSDGETVNYRELLCNALIQFGEMTLESLVAEVIRHIQDDLDLESDESLPERLKVLLENTNVMFERSTANDTEVWRLLAGCGRAVDEHTRARLLYWQPSVQIDDVRPELDHAFDLAISIVRTSPGYKRSEGIIKDIQRCEDLMRSYWEAFHVGADMPAEQELSESPNWTVDAPIWVPYYRELRSSRSHVFSGSCETEKEIRALLHSANQEAKTQGRPLRVRLIGNGWDAFSTDNNCLGTIRREWPHLEFALSIAIPPTVTPNGLFEKGANDGVQWSQYDLAKLARIYEGESPSGKNSPSAEDTVDEHEQPQDDVGIHHEQFLFICQAINCLKLDFSLYQLYPRVQILPIANNALAMKLLANRRNRFPLFGSNTKRGRPKKPTSKLRKNLTCPQCPFSTTDKTTLKRHRKGHTENKPWQCALCQWTTDAKETLVHHVTRDHQIEENATEDHISHRGRPKTRVSRTDATYAERPFACKMCNFRGNSKASLDLHIMVHSDNNEKRFACDKCEYKGRTNAHLKQHMQKHSSPAQQLKCPHCEHLTKWKSALDRHIATLHGPDQFPKCEHGG